MPRPEPYPYSHHVDKTRNEHKCETCGYPIVRGSGAQYKNLYTGERGYIHSIPGCPTIGPAYQVEPVIDHKVRRLCVKPYPGHKKGCPNHGKRETCPPEFPFLEDVLDLSKPTYVVFNTFDLGQHVERMKRKHPGWSDRQLKNCLYWQGTARKQLRAKIKDFEECYISQLDRDNPDWEYSLLLKESARLIVLQCPEACGVNVTATMNKLCLTLEWPPEKMTYQVALAGVATETFLTYWTKKVVNGIGRKE